MLNSQHEEIRRLEALQAVVTEGEIATIERNEAAFGLWLSGVTQKEVSEILDRVDRRCGGSGVTHAMAAKMIARMRAAREERMLADAIA